mgnify:CR=1 FL=1
MFQLFTAVVYAHKHNLFLIPSRGVSCASVDYAKLNANKVRKDNLIKKHLSSGHFDKDNELKFYGDDKLYFITADDDLLYQPTFIQEFRKKIKTNPENSYTGFKWGRGLKVNGKPFEICFGADGVSFKVSKLKTLKDFCFKLFETNIRFKFHDDFCFTSFLHLNGIKTLKLRCPTRIPQKQSKYPQADKASITISSIGGNGKNGVQNDNSLCRLYSKLLNSGKLDSYKI